MFDPPYRFEGYKRGREKDKANGEVLRTVMFSTFLLRLDKDNMDDVCAMSRQINDNNLEFNSRKSAAQEVYAIYEINDKTQEEMEKVVSNEVSARLWKRGSQIGTCKTI